MLAALCTTLFTTALSSLGFSIIALRTSRTVKHSVSFCCAGTAGLANVSARKSAPHRRNSTFADSDLKGSSRPPGFIIGRIPCRIC